MKPLESRIRGWSAAWALLIGLGSIGLLVARSSARDASSGPGAAWRAFDLEGLRAAHAEGGEAYHRFLDEPSLSAGLYVLPAGGTDRQSAHRLDEVYSIISGRATLVIGAQRIAAGPGDVFYVKRGIDHHFEEIEQRLEVLVLFSKESVRGGR